MAIGFGGFVVLFITGVVLYIVGWFLGLKERHDFNRWVEANRRERAGLPPLGPDPWPSVRGCLWSMVIIPVILLFIADYLSKVWH